jgi:hypothetical protein
MCIARLIKDSGRGTLRSGHYECVYKLSLEILDFLKLYIVYIRL